MPKVPSDPSNTSKAAKAPLPPREYLPRGAKRQPTATMPNIPIANEPSRGQPLASNNSDVTAEPPRVILPGSGCTDDLYQSIYGSLPAPTSTSEQLETPVPEHNEPSTLPIPSAPLATRMPMSNNEETNFSLLSNSIPLGTNSSTNEIADRALYDQMVRWESQNGGGPFTGQATTPQGSGPQFANTSLPVTSHHENALWESMEVSNFGSPLNVDLLPTVAARPAIETALRSSTCAQGSVPTPSPQTPHPQKQAPLVSSLLVSYSARRHSKQGLPTEQQLSQPRHGPGLSVSAALGSQPSKRKRTTQPARQDSSETQYWSPAQSRAVQLMKEHYHAFILTKSGWPTPTEFLAAIAAARDYAAAQTGFDFSAEGIDLHAGFDDWIRKQEAKLRGDPKAAVRIAVEHSYGVSILTLPAINNLLAQRAYTFENPEARQGSFRHKGIAAVLEAAIFKGKSSIGYRFMSTKFSPRIPLPTIAFACTLIQNALEDIRTEAIGTKDHSKRAKSLKFDGATYRPIYMEILERLNRYEKDKPDRCHKLQEELTEICKIRCQWSAPRNDGSGISDEFLDEPWSES